MANDPQLELRVSRLENDTISIYDLLTEVRSTQQEHSQRFDQVDQRFDQVDQRFEQLDQRFDQVDQRFDQLDQRFDQLDTTLSQVVRRLPEPS